MLSAETDSAVNSDVSIRRKGQSAVGSRLLPAVMRPGNGSFHAGAFRGSGVEGVAVVKGNQQSGTRRDSVAAGNGTVIQQNDGLDASRRRIFAGFGQIVKLSRANAKDCRGAGNKLRHQRHISRSLKGIRRIIAHDLPGGLVVPAEELVAGSCCGGHSVLRTGGTGFSGFRCDFLSGSCSLRHGVAAAHRGLEGGGHIAGAGADQRQTCDSQGVGIRTFGRCQGDFEGCSVGQDAGVAAARATDSAGNAAAALQGIGKGQRRLAAGAVGQSQLSCNCIFHEKRFIACRFTRNAGAAGRPIRRAFCVAGRRPSCRQAGDGVECARRIGCECDAGEQGEKHRQHQKQRANALDFLLHLFHSFH